MARVGKRYKAAAESVGINAQYNAAEAVKLVKENAKAKFDETIEVAMNLGVDPRHADQMVRGVVQLPNGTGKSVRVVVFAKDAKAEEATAAGADIVGGEDLAAEIQGGRSDFDRCIATPDMMAVVGRLGKVLGPRGLMPNPKSGTVTMDVAKAVREVKAGKIDFKVDRYGIIHASVAKVSFSQEQIKENAAELINTIIRLKPTSAKGAYIKSLTMGPTMGPGLSVEFKNA